MNDDANFSLPRGYLAVAYANSCGHKAIGYLQGSSNDEFRQKYYADYLQALKDFELLGYNHPVLQLADSTREACKLATEFLRHRPRDFRFPTIFIAPSDKIALGAMKAFRDLGYHIPEDISFLGCGNLPQGAKFEPPLTTFGKTKDIIQRGSVYEFDK